MRAWSTARAFAILFVTACGFACAGGAAGPGARGRDAGDGAGAAPPSAPRAAWTRTAAPGLDAAQVDLPEPRRSTYVLRNGLAVQVVERGDRPVVSVRLVLPTGAAGDADAAAGATAIAGVLFAERYEETPTGTRIVDEKTLRYKFAQRGVAFSVQTLQDATVISIDGYAADLSEYLAELADAVKRPRLGRFTYLAVRSYLRERLEDAELADDGTFLELLEQRAFGAGHVYARPVSGTAASLGQLAIEDVQAASKRLFVPRGATLIVAGRVTAREVFGFAEESFGTWRGAAAKSPAVKVRPGATRKQVGYIPRVPSSTLLFCATRSLGDLATSTAELDVMVSILGGTSESRLNRALRERLGLTYGAFGAFIRRRGGNALMFCARSSTCGSTAGRPLLAAHRVRAVERLALRWRPRRARAALATARRASMMVR